MRIADRAHESPDVALDIDPAAGLQFLPGENPQTLLLTGHELFSLHGLSAALTPGGVLNLRAEREGGAVVEFKARIRIDSPAELETFRHGGILHAVVRQLLRPDSRPDFGSP